MNSSLINEAHPMIGLTDLPVRLSAMASHINLDATPPADQARERLTRCELPKYRGLIDYGELRKLASMREVLALLDWLPTARNGPQLRGPCPIHKSSQLSSRSFSVDVERGVFRCFGAKCGKHGNQLDLYASVIGKPLYEASLELAERLGIDWSRIEKRNP
jgi:hypothetical protein